MSVLPPAEAERQRTITWKAPIIDVAKIASLSGLEYLQHLIDDDLPPPIAELLNFRLSRIGPGVAVFEGTPAEYHYNPIGVVHGGFAATLLDSALGCAVHTTLKPGFAYTTVELKVNYVRPLVDVHGSRRSGGENHSCRLATCHRGSPRDRCNWKALRPWLHHVHDLSRRRGAACQVNARAVWRPWQ